MAAVDDLLQEGPVYVIRNDEPRHVILHRVQYEELMEGYEEAYLARIQASLEDAKAGRIRASTAQEIIDEFGLEGSPIGSFEPRGSTDSEHQVITRLDIGIGSHDDVYR